MKELLPKMFLYTLTIIGIPLLVTFIVLKIIQKLTIGKVNSLVCLKGKTAIVTGGCSGIGFQTALALASRGCRVIIADVQDGAKAKAQIIATAHNPDIETKHLDLSSLQSVRKFAQDINNTENQLDILINNAGVGSGGNTYTDDGLHVTMQINYFGHFLLTHLLADLLKKSAPSRIVFVSSAVAYCSNLTADNLNYPRDHAPSFFHHIMTYSNSKLAAAIAANGFAEKLKKHGVTSNSLHPGLVNTRIFTLTAKHLRLEKFVGVFNSTVLSFYGKRPQEGAQTSIHLAVADEVKNVTGKHFWDCISFLQPPGTWNKSFCDDIWKASERLVQLKPEEILV